MSIFFQFGQDCQWIRQNARLKHGEIIDTWQSTPSCFGRIFLSFASISGWIAHKCGADTAKTIYFTSTFSKSVGNAAVLSVAGLEIYRIIMGHYPGIHATLIIVVILVLLGFLQGLSQAKTRRKGAKELAALIAEELGTQQTTLFGDVVTIQLNLKCQQIREQKSVCLKKNERLILDRKESASVICFILLIAAGTFLYSYYHSIIAAWIACFVLATFFALLMLCLFIKKSSSSIGHEASEAATNQAAPT